MINESIEDWADAHGYMHRICPRCHKHYWTDSDEPCPHGCYDYDLYRKEQLAKENKQGKTGDQPCE
jgi:hypothetical protein